MPVVYVAGPYRGVSAWSIECNVRRAEEAALQLWAAGAAVICPHANTRFFQGALPDDVWLAGDLELLRRSDAVMLIEGWRLSKGAMTEWDEAKRLHLPAFTVMADAVRWVESQLAMWRQAEEVVK